MQTNGNALPAVLISQYIENTCSCFEDLSGFFEASAKRLLFLRGLGLSWGGGIGGGGKSMSGGFPVMWPVADKQDIVLPPPDV